MNKLLTLIIVCTLSFSTYLFAEVDIRKRSDLIIDDIDNGSANILIGDVPYKMALNMKVYGSSKQVLNRYALKVGQKVAIKVKDDSKGLKTIFAIKILE